MTLAPPQASAIVAFWRAAGKARWFARSDTFDALTRMRLGAPYRLAARGRLDHWDETPVGSLALLILLDQAPRNMFRGTPRAFATDGSALEIADAALARGFDRRFTKAMRRFFYLPFEHAENEAHQARCVALFAKMGEPQGIRFAEIHADAIARFGRFPHRNAILDRRSTPQETAYLADGGFSG